MSIPSAPTVARPAADYHRAPPRPRGPPLNLKAVVIGGGVAGMTTARALLDAGAQVKVFERRSLEEMLAGPAGLGMQRNAMNALCLLSGASEAASLGHDVAAVSVCDPTAVLVTLAGDTLTRVTDATSAPGSAPAPDQCIRNMTRPALQRALYAALPPNIVTCGAAFDSFSPLPDGRVEVRFVANGGQLPPETADLLVGADGIRSSVRARLDEMMGGPPRQPVYSGYRYYRGLVDLDKLGGEEAWKRSLGGDVNRFFYGRQGTCILYQVSPNKASFARYTPAPAGTSRDIPPEQAKRELEELCREYGSPVPQMAAALEAEAIHVGELWSMPPRKDVWGAGCVTLVGDAAHGMLPTLGQGAGQGVEDSVELAVALHRAAAAKAAACAADASSTAPGADGQPEPSSAGPGPGAGAGPGPGSAATSSAGPQLAPGEVEAVLRRFEAARGAHTARVYDLSISQFRVGVGETWLGRLRRDWTFRLVPVWVIKAASSWLTDRKFSWDEDEAAPSV